MASTDPLTIKTDAFGEGLADNHFKSYLRKITEAVGILIKTVSQTLVCNVKGRQQMMVLHFHGERVSLLPAEVCRGRIVTASLQDENAAYVGGAYGVENGRNIDSPRRGIIMGIRLGFQSCQIAHRHVTPPCRGSDINLAILSLGGTSQEHECKV